MSRPSLFLPLFLIIFGAVWFLRATDILPATSTMIAGALIILGFAVLIMDGINKQSIVSGPMLVYIGTAIYLHMSYWITSRRCWPLAWSCWVVCCCSHAAI